MAAGVVSERSRVFASQRVSHMVDFEDINLNFDTDRILDDNQQKEDQSVPNVSN